MKPRSLKNLCGPYAHALRTRVAALICRHTPHTTHRQRKETAFTTALRVTDTLFVTLHRHRGRHADTSRARTRLVRMRRLWCARRCSAECIFLANGYDLGSHCPSSSNVFTSISTGCAHAQRQTRLLTPTTVAVTVAVQCLQLRQWKHQHVVYLVGLRAGNDLPDGGNGAPCGGLGSRGKALCHCRTVLVHCPALSQVEQNERASHTGAAQKQTRSTSTTQPHKATHRLTAGR